MRNERWAELFGCGCCWRDCRGRPCVKWRWGSQPGARALLRRFEFSQIEMAVTVRVLLYSADEPAATAAAKATFDRVHELNGIMSDYDETSEVRRLCDNAVQKPVAVSPDLWKVLEHAQQVSQRSDGAFDVTVGPVVRLWRRARRQKELPSPEALKKAREVVGYRYIKLDPQRKTVELLKKGMRIDLGGIAKGYAMDEALAVLGKRRHRPRDG